MSAAQSDTSDDPTSPSHPDNIARAKARDKEEKEKAGLGAVVAAVPRPALVKPRARVAFKPVKPAKVPKPVLGRFRRSDRFRITPMGMSFVSGALDSDRDTGELDEDHVLILREVLMTLQPHEAAVPYGFVYTHLLGRKEDRENNSWESAASAAESLPFCLIALESMGLIVFSQ